jgi:hypothetical protein
MSNPVVFITTSGTRQRQCLSFHDHHSGPDLGRSRWLPISLFDYFERLGKRTCREFMNRDDVRAVDDGIIRWADDPY